MLLVGRIAPRAAPALPCTCAHTCGTRPHGAHTCYIPPYTYRTARAPFVHTHGPVHSSMDLAKALVLCRLRCRTARSQGLRAHPETYVRSRRLCGKMSAKQRDESAI